MKMDRLGLPPLMDVVLIGDEAGPRKPDAAIFRQALAMLGMAVSEAWFVGDGPLVDIGGAYAAGLKAIWRESDGWDPPTVPCETIRSLDALLPLLSQASHEER